MFIVALAMGGSEEFAGMICSPAELAPAAEEKKQNILLTNQYNYETRDAKDL